MYTEFSVPFFLPSLRSLFHVRLTMVVHSPKEGLSVYHTFIEVTSISVAEKGVPLFSWPELT